MATLVAHPEHGVAVRKLYDPRGISSPEMIARKEEAGRALGDNQHVAKFLGSAPTPHRGGTMHFNEYVPSQRGQAQAGEWAQQTGNQARSALENVGFQGHDIRKGNMVLDSRTGQHKVIDYMPAKPGEMAAMDSSNPQHITVTPEGARLFNNAQNPTTNKGLLGGMLGGKAMGVRRQVGVPGSGTLIQGGAGTAPRRPSPIAKPAPATQAGFAPGPGAKAPAVGGTDATAIAPHTARGRAPTLPAPFQGAPSSSASTSVMRPQKPNPPSPTSEPATAIARPKPVQGIAPFRP